LPDGFTIGMYRMIAEGKTTGKWVDNTKKPLNNANLTKMLPKGGTLSITATAFHKDGPGDADRIDFPLVKKAAKLSKLAVDYSVLASTVEGVIGDNPLGMWTLREIDSSKNRIAPTKELVAVKPEGKKPVDGELFVAWGAQEVLADKVKAKENTWFVKENASKNADGSFNAATKPKKFAVKAAGKVLVLKGDDPKTVAAVMAIGDKVKVNAKMVYSLTVGEGADAVTTFHPIQAGEKSFEFEFAGTYRFWIAATDKKVQGQPSDTIVIPPAG